MAVPIGHLTSLPSCGLTLLRAPEETFDYVLRVTTDDKRFVRLHCHKAVLKAHSPRLCQLMVDANFFELDIKLAPGFLGAFIELVQYMYLRDLTKISHKNKILKLCAMFDMPLDIFLIRTDAIQPINTYRSVEFTIAVDQDPSACVVVLDFLKRIQFEGARLESTTRIESNLSKDVAVQDRPNRFVSVEVQTEPEVDANIVRYPVEVAPPSPEVVEEKKELPIPHIPNLPENKVEEEPPKDDDEVSITEPVETKPTRRRRRTAPKTSYSRRRPAKKRFR